MSTEYDAREFQTSNFIKKDQLKQSGPKRFTIKAVEKADGIAKGDKPPRPILQLTFVDDTRFGLGTQVNLRRVIELHGSQTAHWIGKDIELYYSPDVRGPGGEEGGIRVRQAAPAVSVAMPTSDFVSVLTSELPAGAKQPF